MTWLGVDLGTQGVRVVAASGDGKVLASASRPLTSRRAGPEHEQDPEDWWTAFLAAAGEVTGQVETIEGIAICGTSGTVLFLDDDARPSTPALMYDDARAAGYVDRLTSDPVEGWLTAGAKPQPTWALAKALWLLDHHDVPAGARLAHQVDLLTHRLVGERVATDTSNALKSGVDLTTLAWPDLGRYGLPADRLPEVVLPGTTLGSVAQDTAGIAAGTKVVAGLTDGCAAQVASGALGTGEWSFVLGTTLVLKGATKTPLRDPDGALYSHRSPDGGWWPGGASSAGAGVLARDFAGRDLAALDQAARQYEPAKALTYPLVSQGERFPFTKPEARAFTTGQAGEAERYASVLQGVGYVERLCLDLVASLGAPIDGPVTLTGGATKSAYWNQLQADILGREVVVPEVADGAFGMAVVAASTAYGSLSAAAAAMVRVRDRFIPREGVSERFVSPYAALVRELAERGWIGERLQQSALAGLGDT